MKRRRRAMQAFSGTPRKKCFRSEAMKEEAKKTKEKTKFGQDIGF